MLRIGTLTQQQTLLAHIQDIQNRLAATQLQAATGKKVQTFSAMAPDVPRYVSMQDARDKYDRYIGNVQLAEQRAKLTDLNLGRMEEIAREMRSMLLAQPQQFGDLASLARNYLREFSDLLNQTDGSRALFAGSNTAGPAVTIYEPGTADPAVPFSGVPGGTSYRYKVFAAGVPADTAIKVSDTLSLNVQVNFNPIAPAIANAMTRAMDALIRVSDFGTAANPAPTQADVDTAVQELSDAMLGVTGSFAGLDGLRLQLTIDRNTLGEIEKSHQRFIAFAADTIGKIGNVDIAEVAARLNSQQVHLEASYAALARISQISLVDFLK